MTLLWSQRNVSIRSTLRPAVQPEHGQSIAAQSSKASVGSVVPSPKRVSTCLRSTSLASIQTWVNDRLGGG